MTLYKQHDNELLQYVNEDHTDTCMYVYLRIILLCNNVSIITVMQQQHEKNWSIILLIWLLNYQSTFLLAVILEQFHDLILLLSLEHLGVINQEVISIIILYIGRN